MAWYVFALVDAAPDGRLGRGLRGPLRARRAAGAFVIAERRADVPPPELGSLRRHQAVVSRLARAVPAILPVRFGTLLEEDALDEALHERDEDIADAFALVRHRVQFTWRCARPPGGRARTPRLPPGPAAGGTEYLRRAATAAKPVPPASFRLLRDRLHSLVVRETFQAASNGVPDTLYHLIDKAAVKRYRARADALTLTTPALTVTGPWPPFAFAPELL